MVLEVVGGGSMLVRQQYERFKVYFVLLYMMQKCHCLPRAQLETNPSESDDDGQHTTSCRKCQRNCYNSYNSATRMLHGCYTDATRMLRDPWQCEGNATEKRSRQTGTMYYGTCLRALLGNTLYMDLQSAARVS